MRAWQQHRTSGLATCSGRYCTDPPHGMACSELTAIMWRDSAAVAHATVWAIHNTALQRAAEVAGRTRCHPPQHLMVCRAAQSHWYVCGSSGPCCSGWSVYSSFATAVPWQHVSLKGVVSTLACLLGLGRGTDGCLTAASMAASACVHRFSFCPERADACHQHV